MDSVLKQTLALYFSPVGFCLLLHWSLLAGIIAIIMLISIAITFTIARIGTEIRLANGGMPRSIVIPTVPSNRIRDVAPSSMMVNSALLNEPRVRDGSPTGRNSLHPVVLPTRYSQSLR